MKILISQLPQSPWWQNGVPLYDDNPAMRLGAMPDQSILEKERLDLISILNDLNIEIIELPFPSAYNTDPIKHDFVYIRDPFITNQKGKAVILRMKEPNRRGESKMAGQLLEKMGMEITRIPDKPGLYAEGGEFYFCPKENILFNNPKAILTPHIAASTAEASIVVAEMAANQISDFLLKGVKINTV